MSHLNGLTDEEFLQFFEKKIRSGQNVSPSEMLRFQEVSKSYPELSDQVHTALLKRCLLQE